MSVKLVAGDTWQRAWIIQDPDGNPIDLSGITARVQVRDAKGQLVLSASTSDGRITVTPAQGRIDMTIPSSATQIAAGVYVFGLEVAFPSGTRRTYEQDQLVVEEDYVHD